MFLDNLLPDFTGALGAPACFLKRLRYPDMVSFGLLANLSKMRAKGVISDIDSIWDVGANQGQYALMASIVWPQLPVYSFEPDPESYKKLERNFNKHSISGKTFCYALGDTVQTRRLIRYGNNVNNSLLERGQSESDVLEFVPVECTTLDVVSNNFPTVSSALLKLDVQGFELSVLAGAGNFLRKCSYVLVEVSFSPSYKQGAHAGEVIMAMRDCGFVCIEILDLLRDKKSRNRIIEADLLFARSRTDAQ